MRSLDFTEEKSASVSACYVGRSEPASAAVPELNISNIAGESSLDLSSNSGPIILSDEDQLVLSGGILERTLLMLEVDGVVLAEDISAFDIRQDRWSCTLSVTARVAVVDIVSEGNSLQAVNTSLSKKRKLDAI